MLQIVQHFGNAEHKPLKKREFEQSTTQTDAAFIQVTTYTTLTLSQEQKYSNTLSWRNCLPKSTVMPWMKECERKSILRLASLKHRTTSITIRFQLCKFHVNKDYEHVVNAFIRWETGGLSWPSSRSLCSWSHHDTWWGRSSERQRPGSTAARRSHSHYNRWRPEDSQPIKSLNDREIKTQRHHYTRPDKSDKTTNVQPKFSR